MTPEEFDTLNENHPYFSYLNFDDTDIIGIVTKR